MDYREALAHVISLLYHRGLVQIRGGNASIIDRSHDLIYITPTGLPRTLIKPSDIAVIKLNGEKVEGVPSSEWRLHTEIYKMIREAKAIVHAHPPITIAFGEAGVDLDLSVTTEAGNNITCVSKIPPLKPGSIELAKETANTMMREGCNVALLRRHGIVAYSSKSIFHALDIIEALEDLAKTLICKKILNKYRGI
ncbi:MAG: class II aldolase/adducin family protein [Desulfurococcales archaeon]|nr:class II aldolase/adducin family protein [Desulfurococcales archaeon]